MIYGFVLKTHKSFDVEVMQLLQFSSSSNSLVEILAENSFLRLKVLFARDSKQRITLLRKICEESTVVLT